MINNYRVVGSNLLEITISNNVKKYIELNEDSGKVVWRQKNDFWGRLLNVRHTGICVGADMSTKENIYIHNHILEGYAHITTEQVFSQGLPIYFDLDICTNSPLKVIQIALSYVQDRVKYRLLDENCQILTSNACTNLKKSPDAEKIVGYGSLFFIGWLILGRKSS